MSYKKTILYSMLVFILLSLSACDLVEEIIDEVLSEADEGVTLIEDLQDIEHFRPGALEHILEGELNRKGQAVGFHYDRLPTKKGEIIPGSRTEPNSQGVYEAKISVSGVDKTSNRGVSSFFPDEWDSQDVVDAINEAYENKQFISGNTFEGLTDEGIVVRMYLDDREKIISAFPVY